MNGFFLIVFKYLKNVKLYFVRNLFTYFVVYDILIVV